MGTLRILMINYEFPPVGGGAANVSRYLFEEFQDRSVQIDLVTSSPEGYSEESFSDNITIYRLDVGKGELNVWKQREAVRFAWESFKKSRELTGQNEYDLIHAWSGIPSGLVAANLDYPLLVSLIGSDVPGFSKRFKNQYRILRPVIKWVWKCSNEIVPNSKKLKNEAQSSLEREMNVIPTGIDTEKFYPSKSKKSGSKHLKVLTVSRLTPRKRVEDIIRAVKMTEKVKLDIIGSGEQKDYLKQLADELEINDRINFQGHIPEAKLPNQYRQADVFVMPSLNEGMSNSLLEAMASGLPSIVTETGGTEELIDGNGIIVDKKSPRDISEALKFYRDNETRRCEHSRKSREIAEKFQWPKIADMYLQAYNNISE